MPRQTLYSPCFACDYPKCNNCTANIYAVLAALKGNVKETNIFIENLWRECEDIAFIEHFDGLVLDQPWRGFTVGEFDQEDLFHFIDEHHSKGIGWVYENISPYNFERGTE